MDPIATAQVVLYALLGPPALYVLVKHGRPGILGWLYLFVFCTLRVIGGAMSIAGSEAAGIVSNIGLSPLLLAVTGIVHES